MYGAPVRVVAAAAQGGCGYTNPLATNARAAADTVDMSVGARYRFCLIATATPAGFSDRPHRRILPMSDPTGATPRSIWTGENFRALLACVTALVE